MISIESVSHNHIVIENIDEFFLVGEWDVNFPLRIRLSNEEATMRYVKRFVHHALLFLGYVCIGKMTPIGIDRVHGVQPNGDKFLLRPFHRIVYQCSLTGCLTVLFHIELSQTKFYRFSKRNGSQFSIVQVKTTQIAFFLRNSLACQWLPESVVGRCEQTPSPTLHS